MTKLTVVAIAVHSLCPFVGCMVWTLPYIVYAPLCLRMRISEGCDIVYAPLWVQGMDIAVHSLYPFILRAKSIDQI